MGKIHCRDAVLRRLYRLMPQLRRQALHIGRGKYLDGIIILPRLGVILMLCVDTPTSCCVEGKQFMTDNEKKHFRIKKTRKLEND